MTTMTLAAPDGPCEAYVSGSSGPGILYCIDAIGLRPTTMEMADRIASWGYVVLVPNTLYRSGTAAETTPTGDLREAGAREAFMRPAMARVGALTAPRLLADAASYLDALASLPEVTGHRFAAVGYCMGARMAMYAAADPRVVAVAGFHGGRLATEDPDSPHLVLAGSQAGYLFGHADHDAGMDPAAQARLQQALDAADLRGSASVYSGAAHGYSMADTSSYDESATERMYTELRAFLTETMPPS